MQSGEPALTLQTTAPYLDNVQAELQNVVTTKAEPLELQLFDATTENDEVHLFALTDDGKNVLVRVCNSPYYFYADAPYHFTPVQCNGFCAHLNTLVLHATTAKKPVKRTYAQAIDDLDEVIVSKDPEKPVKSTTIELKKSLWCYQPHPGPVIKITLTNPRYKYDVLNVLEQGFDVGTYAGRPFPTYESKLKPHERFMLDHNIVGMGWFSITNALCVYSAILQDQNGGAERSSRRNPQGVRRQSSCNLEFIVDAADVGRVDSLRLAPYRILSYDIECLGRPGIFPEPEHDPVINIGNELVLRGSESRDLDRSIFVLNTCSNIIGANVHCFAHEDQLLGAWASYVLEKDPLIITGYNIVRFDFVYLLERAEHIARTWNASREGRPCACASFALLGKYFLTANADGSINTWSLKRAKTCAKNKFSQSNQSGKRESKEIKPLWGRLLFDMIEVITKDYKLNSYSLNSVSQNFLKDQKDDLHYSLIPALHRGTDQDRRRIAVYCLKDCLLPIRLMDKLMSLLNYIEMARATGVPFNYLLTRGVGVRVQTKILTYTKQSDVLFPDAKCKDPFDFEGALVVTPKKGFYDVPIPVLDFASLYPSIMMAHNLCYSAHIPKNRSLTSLNLTEADVFTTVAGHRFVLKTKYMGILPRVLYDLVDQRNKAKADMKKEKDEFKKAVFNARQLALKVVCNSVYGFTGAPENYPMVAIAESVTLTGQQMNVLSQDLARKRILETIYADTPEAAAYRASFGIVGGIENFDVIYGDTDSIMIKLGFPSINTADPIETPRIMGEVIRVYTDLATHISAKFTPPIRLEAEKILYPFLLLSKKKYAGLYWTEPSHPRQPDPMHIAGIESVRRDWCSLVKIVVETSLDLILIKRDVPGAITFVKSIISELLTNRVDISHLILSKQLSTDYKSKQPHAELAERMRKRDPGTAPNVGDRVPYVIIQSGMRDKIFEKTEDPIYAMEHDLIIDAKYYVEKQLAGPVRRIFGPLVKDVDAEILSGEHTRHVIRATPSAAHGIAAFAVKRSTCAGCRVPIPENAILCAACVPHSSEIYAKQVAEMNQLQAEFSILWTNCQRCQGSFHQDVLCTSNDCAVYYKRTRVKKDLTSVTARVERHRAFQW